MTTKVVKDFEKNGPVTLQSLKVGDAFLDGDGDPGFRVSDVVVGNKITTLIYYQTAGTWLCVEYDASATVTPIDAEVSFGS